MLPKFSSGTFSNFFQDVRYLSFMLQTLTSMQSSTTSSNGICTCANDALPTIPPLRFADMQIQDCGSESICLRICLRQRIS